jgi:hypothetical protein
MRQGRFFLALILLLGSLTAVTGSSVAQSAGSELVEDVAAEAAGDGAYVALASVEAFAVEGGEAIFEAGTVNEEVFSYDSADLNSSRLVGLTRPNPLAHAAGVFVQVREGDVSRSAEPSPTASAGANDPSSSSSDDEAPSTPAPSHDPGGPEGAREGEAMSESSGSTDQETCITDRPASECVNEVVGELCSEGSVCETVGQILADPCGFFGIQCIVPNPFDIASDPCGYFDIECVLPNPDDIVSDPCGFAGIDCTLLNPCDPNNSGQTCPEYIFWSVLEIAETVDETLQFEPCSLWFPSDPQVGDLGPPVNRRGVVVGDAAADCSDLPVPFTLVVCMEYGPFAFTATRENCFPFGGTPSAPRADGFSFGACRPGTWRTWAGILPDGSDTFVMERHSAPASITVDDCTGPTSLPLPLPGPT